MKAPILPLIKRFRQAAQLVAARKILLPRIMQSNPAVDSEQEPPMPIMVFVGNGNGTGKTAIVSGVVGVLNQNGVSDIAIFGSSAFSKVFDHRLLKPIQHTYRTFLDKVIKGDNSVICRFADGVFQQAMDEVFKRNASIIIDNHMSQPSFVEEMLKKAKASKYETLFIAPHVEMPEVYSRLEKRKKETGRSFDPKTVERTHAAFAYYLPAYFKAFQAGIVLDNTAGASLTPIAFSRDGAIHIIDHEALDTLSKKAKGFTPASNSPSQFGAIHNLPVKQSLSIKIINRYVPDPNLALV